jgi:membrane-associated phospholipid phosphatase
MHVLRLAACALVLCALSVPALAQEPLPPENTDGAVTATTPDGGQIQLPPTGRLEIPLPPTTPVESTNVFKLTAGDFKNFFSADTAKVMSYVSLIAIASAPWDRQGVNNGFNIPTTAFQSGNVIGQFAFQLSAGAATFAIGKSMGNTKAAMVGRDIIRAQILSQALVQTLKHTVQRERPDGSNSASFPSGHSASAFATATVLQRHYGWKVGAPAYALGGYIALARMAWNRHHATDVVMGAGFGIASARTVTMSVAKTRFNVGVRPEVGGASVNFTKVVK